MPTKNEVTEILQELWRFEKTQKYSDTQIRQALEFAMKAVDAYRDCENCVNNVRINHMRGCIAPHCEYTPKEAGNE